MTRKEKALQIFAQDFHCSQAVLAAYADLGGITEKQALKLGGCFGSALKIKNSILQFILDIVGACVLIAILKFVF